MSTLTPPLTDTEAAAYLRVSRKTLADWRYRGIGPAYAKAGRWVRYRAADLDSWLAAGGNRSAS